MNIWNAIYKTGVITIGILSLILVVWLFAPKIRTHHDLQKIAAKSEADVRLEQEIFDHLRRQQERLRNDPRFVEKLAREELGLAKPGEMVFKFVDDDVPSNTAPRR